MPSMIFGRSAHAVWCFNLPLYWFWLAQSLSRKPKMRVHRWVGMSRLRLATPTSRHVLRLTSYRLPLIGIRKGSWEVEWLTFVKWRYAVSQGGSNIQCSHNWPNRSCPWFISNVFYSSMSQIARQFETWDFAKEWRNQFGCEIAAQKLV